MRSMQSRYVLNLDISRSISTAMKHGHSSMRHRHEGHRHRGHLEDPDTLEGRGFGRPGHRRHGLFSRERRGGRPFDYGELRLLALAMIAEQPRHGYELMKAIEERMGGSYTPSPGVMYPTLSWLEDMGYAAVELQDAGRKRYRITAEGEAFLATSGPAVEALFARIGPERAGGRADVPAPILR